jgi:cysteine desulfurase
MHALDLDHAASTPLLPEAWEAMRPFALERSGNPASSHRLGRAARQGLEDARERIAACLGAEPDEVVFTSGATEANNLAVRGLADAGAVLVSTIEHPSVLEPIANLGRPIAPLPVDAAGVAQVPATLPGDLGLGTLMLVNHETGAIQPVADLVRRLADYYERRGLSPPGRLNPTVSTSSAGINPAARQSRLLDTLPIHCDAAAAVGKIPVRFRELGISTLTASAHKFHGPKGVGVLLVRRGTRLGPQLFGGHQQQGRRPGTEPVWLAVGMAVALEWACRSLERHREHVARLRSRLLDRLAAAAPIHVNGDGVPHILNVSFPGCRADALLMALDLAGVACSTGSACSSGSLLPSPVLRAMGVPLPILESAMRFSFGPLTTIADIDLAAEHILNEVSRLRRSESTEAEA